jgi:hypothetical protein
VFAACYKALATPLSTVYPLTRRPKQVYLWTSSIILDRPTPLILYATHPTRRSSYTPLVLYAARPIRRSFCTPLVLYAAHSIHTYPTHYLPVRRPHSRYLSVIQAIINLILSTLVLNDPCTENLPSAVSIKLSKFSITLQRFRNTSLSQPTYNTNPDNACCHQGRILPHICCG